MNIVKIKDGKYYYITIKPFYGLGFGYFVQVLSGMKTRSVVFGFVKFSIRNRF